MTPLPALYYTISVIYGNGGEGGEGEEESGSNSDNNRGENFGGDSFLD